METAYLSLGSNLGDRKKHLFDAVELLNCQAGKVLRQSSILETEAMGFAGKPFLNQVIKIETDLSPFALLAITQNIEIRLGRTSKSFYRDGKPVYQNRTIDIDILEFGNYQIQSEKLTLPHPKMRERDFVMIPYLEIKNKKS